MKLGRGGNVAIPADRSRAPSYWSGVAWRQCTSMIVAMARSREGFKPTLRAAPMLRLPPPLFPEVGARSRGEFYDRAKVAPLANARARTLDDLG